MTLQTTLFKDFVLSNPLWIASAQFSDSPQSIKQWADLDSPPSAITLKTTADSRRLTATSTERRRLVALEMHKDPILGALHEELSVNYFTDGPKNIELLSLNSTVNLLSFAKDLLPQTKIGVSVLMGEDYKAAATALKNADFVELNLKYSVRLGPDDVGKSFFSIHNARFGEVLDHIKDFCKINCDKPVFIKLTRELPWLTPCLECQQLLQTVAQMNRSGQRVGLIIANTQQLRIPACWIAEQEMHRYRGELAKGVLTGQHLFLGTYNLIRNLVLEYEECKTIPIIATGGILNINTLLEVVRAGARAVQLCTALMIYKTSYYSWLEKHLQEVMGVAGYSSYDHFVRFLQGESDDALDPVRRLGLMASFKAEDSLAHVLKEKFPSLLTTWKDVVVKDVAAVGTPERGLNLSLGKGPVVTASSEGLPDLISPEEGAEPTLDRTLIHIRSPKANIGAHLLANLLSERGYHLHSRSRGRDVAVGLSDGKWDLAILPDSSLAQTVNQDGMKSGSIVVLGKMCSTTHYLYALREQSTDVHEIYYFLSREADWCLERLRGRKSISDNALLTPTRTSQLVFFMMHPRKHVGFFAKEPLASIYTALSREDKFNVVERESLDMILIASKDLCDRIGAAGLQTVYADIRAAKAAVQVWEPKAQELLESLIREVVFDYLPPTFGRSLGRTVAKQDQRAARE